MNEKTETLYGFHPVFETLKSGRRKIFEIYLAKKTTGRTKKIVGLAEKLKVPVRNLSNSKLNLLTGTELHQDIGARASGYPYATLAELLNQASKSNNAPLLLFLDNLSDPQNLGAIIRTAVCAGVDGVILPKHRACTATPAVSKASAGALEHVLLVRVTNLVNTIKTIKKEGIWVAGIEKASKQSLFKSELKGPMAFVIGSEGKGIRPHVKNHCDFLYSIPQTDKINSLNASVAAAVVLYEAIRQRT